MTLRYDANLKNPTVASQLSPAFTWPSEPVWQRQPLSPARFDFDSHTRTPNTIPVTAAHSFDTLDDMMKQLQK
eukprot:CAMPEP_0169125222 /NCGR_PEP_ID=MMETSP1015-20121227/34764_1 /TAXON_ID=342587 /ORGANISM="Karlodinium micrum, Strain CCMP2283" /LENGTH=72 /DNA_ID=CAMNT_0009188733 /DNA_START=117 /DNA_END=335 /DNA_ORIENTATION=+